MHELASRLYPVPRSLTGDGVRETLGVLGERVPLEVHEVPSGTRVFDWTVPKEWNLRAAWIKDPEGRTVVDVAEHGLHVLGYSVPVQARLPLAELRNHLFTLPEQADRIPYRTSYYAEAWGFCLRHSTLEALEERELTREGARGSGEYEVCIDATLEDGSLTYGELVVPGTGEESEREVLVSTHVCHPMLANDNLSGLVVTTELARRLLELPRRRYTYRFLWIPGTIGSITWLATHRDEAARIAHGLVAANLGDPGAFTYKRSRRGHAEIDRAVEHLLRASGESFEVEDFVPFGYDERQYNSPGFDLPVGSLTRTPWGRYPEYHTSADDLAFLRPESLSESLDLYLKVAGVLEGNRSFRSTNPYCEPQLGRRGLYSSVGGASHAPGAERERRLALLWVLNLADGDHTLLDVAERSGIAFALLRRAADDLLEAGLLEVVAASGIREEDEP
jgi:aminopeptidase-like protein